MRLSLLVVSSVICAAASVMLFANYLPNDIAPTKRGDEQLISLQDEAIDPDIKLLVKIIFNGTDSSSTSKRDDKQLIGLQDKSFDLDIKGLSKLSKTELKNHLSVKLPLPKFKLAFELASSDLPF
ncbi:hypothetical protein E3P92_03092 [Wallemia ichthyophaga]|uniref:Uncharacterized protein n=1 Tax=Wallemia ichthyophaga TaxID=245174 RepID=A0A4V4LYR5_WALIC|nr:hypothetical protein E3P98_03091 [Wallemia ichthyophaga]TIA97210.1 hypothetical protein E3P95_02978 [Wallemia ichthyophaga]TIA98387.1 hypothetical protein E3P94_02979 [Wallemia ichthyophaga]TIB10044.1 hypothetical protein E3P90_03019 [Wallemia ichthyophaga]TIB10108.1 hypothetical protein E3P93_03023 [Wallemia ichthyophaga]